MRHTPLWARRRRRGAQLPQQTACNEQVADIAREVQMSHTLEGHPNILPMTATYEDKDTVWLVLVRIFALCVRVFALLVPVCASVARFSALSVRLFESSVPLFEPLERRFFFQELCEGGELFDRILAKGGLYSEKDAATIIRSILSVRRMRSECK